jgi:hypothetical protein
MDKLINSLPFEIAQKIWRTYYSLAVLPEMKTSLMFETLQKCFRQQCKYDIALDEYIKYVSMTYDNDPEHFWACYDCVEDRIVTDDWFVWDSMQYSLNVLLVTKDYIDKTSYLKRELQSLSKGKANYIVMTSNLKMLKNLFES